MAILDGNNSNNVIDGGVTSFSDFGGTDTYTISGALSADVTITDNDTSIINLPAGVDITGANFLADGVQFMVNGFTVTLLGNPANFSFVFGGNPLNPAEGTPLSFDDTAVAFGTTVPDAGDPPNAATVTGVVNDDGSLGDAPPPPPVLDFVLSGPSTVDEGESASYTVTASEPVTEDTDVTFMLAAGDPTAADQGTTSTNLNDFAEGEFTPVTVTILAGETTAEFDVTSLNDAVTELDEDFTVTADVEGFGPLTPVTTTILDGGLLQTVLTTGLDVVPGSSGQDLIIGLFEDDGMGNPSPTSTFTLGDVINGGSGEDILQVFNASEFNLTFAGRTITDVEQIEVIHADNNLNDIDFTGANADMITVDFAGNGDVGFYELNNIEPDVAVVVQNIGGDADNNVNINFAPSNATTAMTDVTIQDLDVDDFDSIIDAEFSDATSYAFNLLLSDIDAQDDLNLNANIDLNEPLLDLLIDVVLENLSATSGGEGDINLNFNTNGVETATANVDIIDTNISDFDLQIDNFGNGTGEGDTLNLLLDDVIIRSDLTADDFEQIDITIEGDVDIQTINFFDAEGAQSINIVANGNLTVGGDVNINDNSVDQTITITGMGDVDLNQLDFRNDANTTQILDASALTGDLTVEDGNFGSIDQLLGGSGDDSILLSGIGGTTEVMAGAGNDFVDTNGQDYGDANASTLDGGAGDMDIIAIDDAMNFDAATADNISNFEILEIGGGTGIYDLSLEASIVGVQITDDPVAALGATQVIEAAAGTTLDFIIDDAGGVTIPLSDETFVFALADDSGSSDSLDILLQANDDDDDQTIEGQISAGVTADGIEEINFTSNATTSSEESAPGADDALSPGDYTNDFTLIGDAVDEITIAGDAQFDLQIGVLAGAATVVTLIDATANTAGVDIDLATSMTNTTSVAFDGSDLNDMFLASANGDVVQGNGGSDDIIFDGGLGMADEVARYVEASDSQAILVDNDDDGDSDLAEGVDTIANFGTNGVDLIELSSQLGLAGGDAQADIIQLGTFAVTEDVADIFDGFGADLFDTGLVDRATAFFDAGGDGFLLVDADSDGDFDAANDMVIQLLGVTAFDITDITFG